MHLRESNRDRGFSVLELLVVMGISAIIFSLAVLDTKSYGNQALNGASTLMGFLKSSRAKALATTQAYTLTATSPTHVASAYSTNCASATQTLDPALSLDLPDGAVFTATPWTVCFTPRGLSDSSIDIQVQDQHSAHTVQVVLGGAIRVQ
ncbi:MAG: prepilin-type N-terminal cleavage/methylation domain-containing protein [Deltaproteobacteria bacterium]|nr:prepilin-type N-terminal cleavage/methylation domain-containing protein [Deltaproteobacteria bacterium]